MTAIFAAKNTLTPSADQSATGPVSLIASGTFNGATLLIEVKGDGQAWAPLHQFKFAAAISLALAVGHTWRASLQDIGPNTSINLSAI